jgi:hypothetical protein
MSILARLSSRIRSVNRAKGLGHVHRRKTAFHAGLDRLEERSLLTVTPIGPETLVNSTVAGDQGFLTSWSGEGQVNSVAADSSGNYVVVWEGNGPADSYGVFAQRFAADGTPRGSEFRVNSTTTDPQVGPVAAMDHAGDFAVAWSTRVSAVGGNVVVYARVFNADGSARTGDIQVTPASTSQANFATSIAMDAGGDFVVVSDGWVKSGRNTNSGIIQFQRYNAQGQAQGKLVQVDDTTVVNGTAAVAMDGVGNFAVAWDDTDAIGARVQRYSASGKKVGSLIATGFTFPPDQSDLRRPSIAMDEAGDFAVTAYGQVRSFNATGAPLGPVFDFASLLAGAGYRSAVAIDTQGNAVVSWTDYSGGSTGDVFGQRVSPAGVALESSFTVNTTLNNVQAFPSVATTPGGGFVAVWCGNGPGDDSGAFSQRFTTAAGSFSSVHLSAPTPEFAGPSASLDRPRDSNSDLRLWAMDPGRLAISTTDLASDLFAPRFRRSRSVGSSAVTLPRPRSDV